MYTQNVHTKCTHERREKGMTETIAHEWIGERERKNRRARNMHFCWFVIFVQKKNFCFVLAQIKENRKFVILPIYALLLLFQK